MKTIKQIADELGITKQKVYRYIRKNHINEAYCEAGVMCYDEAAEILIKSYFKQKGCIDDAHQVVSNDALIDVAISMLQQEIEVKNEQIRALNDRLAESNAALMVAQQSAQTAQALHARTMAKQLADGETADNLQVVEIPQNNVVPEIKPRNRFFNFFQKNQKNRA